MDIIIIPALGDNYSYLGSNGSQAFVVDPSEAQPILMLCHERKVTLTMILNTHAHGDHTGGNRIAKQQTNSAVYGPSGVTAADYTVKGGERISFGDTTVTVIATPGHSQADVCYYVHASPAHTPGIIWTGDTLFVGGCGRPFGNDISLLWKSLLILATLPDDTLVYPGHNYTVENYEFSLSIEPDNEWVKKRLHDARERERLGEPTVPSTMGEEKQSNIFLRSGSRAVKCALNMNNASDQDVFRELRRRKNISW